MNVRTNAEGVIIAYGDAEALPGSTPVPEDATIPEDFSSAFAGGKYKLEDGEIVQNPDWVEP